MSTQPIPVVDWLATDDEWRAARRKGCGASDVAAILGFSAYRSPWQVWAEKTGHPMAPTENDLREETAKAGRLGDLLEPWLVDQLHEVIDLSPVDGYEAEVRRSGSRTYGHPEHPWRLASPDAYVHITYPHPVLGHQPGHVWLGKPPLYLVEAKTAGLQTGRAHGWTDESIPLGYELQVRWQMHVMDASLCHVVALVAGRGLCHYPITRDLDLEAELVRQVDAWWTRHIIGGEEPPLTGRDSTIIAALYPRVERKTVNLDGTGALNYWQAYRDAHDEVREAEARKAEAGTALKALLGDAHTGLVDGRPIATWGERKGRVDWEKIARELYEIVSHDLAGDLPDLDALAEQHRGPTTRTLTIKE